ncbi:nucleotidyltransferase family protein [Candidatus Blastococcus massiliensis]|uniref:nucleotidyltransferase family protein n=1 Tax=Candidatus Blastococcus massiliensis TaxID=1470358 RepID=UPI0004B3FAA6|nr:nucleotidyltransferase family protein [Candidatus Blastococcus massiliensis]
MSGRPADGERFLRIVTVDVAGRPRVYAPHGFDDLFDLVVRPNRRLAPREVAETNAARWLGEWPELTVLPWTDPGRPAE